jgi:hypothetical protein
MTKKKPAMSCASSMAGLFSRTRSNASIRAFSTASASNPSEPMREFIEELWPELVHKLPPKKAHG